MVQKPEDFIPSKESSDDLWISWYQALKSELGTSDANILFKQTWDVRGNSTANTDNLRTFMQKQGITIKKDFTEAVLDIVTSPFGIFNFAADVGKTVVYGTIIFLFLFLALIIYFLYNASKNPGETVGTAAKIALA